ncbi:hypothetical protein [Herbidospora cretacea]|uniref:hypothetical protein n=1 Tax=Herbidospora cretacea TaxID=28444 RepID=UPI000A8BD44E|nr:hypothetical protein [Herbidospora cretacea]
MIGALGYAVLTGEWHVFFLAAVGDRFEAAELWLVLAVLVTAGLRGWVLWALLVRPPLQGPPWIRVLRVLLYLNLIVFLLGPVVQPVAGYAAFLLTLPVVAMLPLAFGQAPLAVRVVVAVAGLAGCLVPFVVDLPGPAVVWPIGVVLLQVFCRSSPLTRWLGLVALVHAGAMSMLPSRFTTYQDLSALWLLLDALAVTQALWLAHTAADLGRDHTDAPAAPLPFRVGALALVSAVAGLVAVTALRPPMVVVDELVIATEPEAFVEDFPPQAAGCEPWTVLGGQYATTAAQDREKAYLCLVRRIDPRNVPDETLLAEGRARCAAADPLYRRDMERLIYLCPERATDTSSFSLLLGQGVEDALHEKCTDPWPRDRDRRQLTIPFYMDDPAAGYRLGADGPADAPPGYPGEIPVAVGAGVQAVCVTMKTLPTAPPVRAGGWRSVVEVPLRSADGGFWVRGTYPQLAHDTPAGRQRIRLYARDLATPGLKAEQHLIVVFPGRSAKRVVHK